MSVDCASTFSFHPQKQLRRLRSEKSVISGLTLIVAIEVDCAGYVRMSSDDAVGKQPTVAHAV